MCAEHFKYKYTQCYFDYSISPIALKEYKKPLLLEQEADTGLCDYLSKQTYFALWS